MLRAITELAIAVGKLLYILGVERPIVFRLTGGRPMEPLEVEEDLRTGRRRGHWKDQFGRVWYASGPWARVRYFSRDRTRKENSC